MGRAAILLAVVALGCAMNPVSRRPEVALISSAKEQELGREQAQEVARTMGLVDDAQLAAYVAAVGARLAAVSPRTDVTYAFQVVDTPEPNAFALPGGWIYVSRGLLVLMSSEDELAGVLGHEIAHVAARHAVQRVSRAAPLGVLSGLGAAATGVVSPMLGRIVGGVGSTANALILAPYGRDQEREADRVGAELVAKAGWDPMGLAAALRTLEREDGLHPDRGGGGFFATHPPLPERVDTVEAEARGLARAPAAPVAASRAGFLQHLDGLVVGLDAADGVFVGDAFVDPDLSLALTFPKGWKAGNERTAVWARDAQRRVLVALTIAGAGDDPAAPLAALDAANGTELAKRAERLEVDGRPAVHVVAAAQSDAGPVTADLTWIAHAGRILRITGVAQQPDFDAYATTFRAVARSVRTPSATERSAVREARVRLVRAPRGDTVERLAARPGSTWDAAMVRIANGMADGAQPAAGEVVKVAVSEPYRGRR